MRQLFSLAGFPNSATQVFAEDITILKVVYYKNNPRKMKHFSELVEAELQLVKL